MNRGYKDLVRKRCRTELPQVRVFDCLWKQNVWARWGAVLSVMINLFRGQTDTHLCHRSKWPCPDLVRLWSKLSAFSHKLASLCLKETCKVGFINEHPLKLFMQFCAHLPYQTLLLDNSPWACWEIGSTFLPAEIPAVRQGKHSYCKDWRLETFTRMCSKMYHYIKNKWGKNGYEYIFISVKFSI